MSDTPTKIDIPVLDVGPKFVLLAKDIMAYHDFDSFPALYDPVTLFMVSEHGMSTRHFEHVREVDLESIAAFVASGNAYSVHPKRMLGNLAWWAKIRGVVNADTYYRAFMGINDLAVLCNAPDAPLSMDERMGFDLEDVAYLTDHKGDYTSEEEILKDCFKLCQKLSSAR